jgi:hypothetical protein
VTTTKINVMTPEERKRLREELERQTQEYLNKGGAITQCPPNAFTETDKEGKTKFQKLIKPDSLTDPTKRILGGFIFHKKGE